MNSEDRSPVSPYDEIVEGDPVVPGDDPAMPDNTSSLVADTSDSAPAEVKTIDSSAVLRADIAGLRGQVEQFQRVADRLHQDNEQLRRGQLDRILEPVIRDLLKLADDWRRMGLAWDSDRESATPSDVAKACFGMVEDITTILERNGVEQCEPEVGSVFDRREQRAVGTAAVADPALEATVNSVRRPGYRLGHRMLRFPEVLVNRVVAAPEAG